MFTPAGFVSEAHDIWNIEIYKRGNIDEAVINVVKLTLKRIEASVKNNHDFSIPRVAGSEIDSYEHHPNLDVINEAIRLLNELCIIENVWCDPPWKFTRKFECSRLLIDILHVCMSLKLVDNLYYRHLASFFMSCDMLEILAMSHKRNVFTESIEYDNCNALYVMGSLIQIKYYKHNGSLYWVPDHLQSPLQFDIHRNCKDIDNNSCKEVNNIREYAWKQIYEYIVGVNLVPEQHIYTQNLIENIISTVEYTVITTCTMMVRSFYHSTYIDILNQAHVVLKRLTESIENLLNFGVGYHEKRLEKSISSIMTALLAIVDTTDTYEGEVSYFEHVSFNCSRSLHIYSVVDLVHDLYRTTLPLESIFKAMRVMFIAISKRSVNLNTIDIALNILSRSGDLVTEEGYVPAHFDIIHKDWIAAEVLGNDSYCENMILKVFGKAAAWCHQSRSRDKKMVKMIQMASHPSHGVDYFQFMRNADVVCSADRYNTTIPDYNPGGGCEGTDAEVTHWCQTCDKPLCSFCVDAHKCQKHTKPHILTAISISVEDGVERREFASSRLICVLCEILHTYKKALLSTKDCMHIPVLYVLETMTSIFTSGNLVNLSLASQKFQPSSKCSESELSPICVVMSILQLDQINAAAIAHDAIFYYCDFMTYFMKNIGGLVPNKSRPGNVGHKQKIETRKCWAQDIHPIDIQNAISSITNHNLHTDCVVKSKTYEIEYIFAYLVTESVNNFVSYVKEQKNISENNTS